jgi:hypothetical protein
VLAQQERGKEKRKKEKTLKYLTKKTLKPEEDLISRRSCTCTLGRGKEKKEFGGEGGGAAGCWRECAPRYGRHRRAGMGP